MSLIHTIQQGLTYSSSWGIWAKPVRGKGIVIDSPCRFGQRCFENGGLPDGWWFVGSNKHLIDSLWEYCEDDQDAIWDPDIIEDWLEEYLSWRNEVIIERMREIEQM
jgi:hypothetical protein